MLLQSLTLSLESDSILKLIIVARTDMNDDLKALSFNRPQRSTVPAETTELETEKGMGDFCSVNTNGPSALYVL